MHPARLLRIVAPLFAVLSTTALTAQQTPRPSAQASSVAEGQSAFADYTHEKPGTVHKITLSDLPQPKSTKSVDNPPDVVSRPRDAWPQVPPGFKVELYAGGLDRPRLIRTAPNGDVFVAESEAGRVLVFRGIDANGKAEQKEVFATGLHLPFGIAFYPAGANPQWVYIGDTDAVVRFPYRTGDLKARGTPQRIARLPSGAGHLGGGGHWTRDIAFSADGKKMFVSVGSYSNNDDTDRNPRERNRADILEFNPDGSGERVYAYGIRNAVGIAVEPGSGHLWGSVNERDELGDNLPPDYITHIQAGGFYGWPWYYMGGHQDPRHAGKHPELKDKVITPDVLLQPHTASLEMVFYDGQQFPAEYRGSIFAAEHGSWNRRKRTGYEVIRVPTSNGRATGEYEDFVTGFVTSAGKVWGRPVGVAVAKDGSLLISDDGSNSIWRVSHAGR
jgi:glucose/arabinose dehydrogenase